MISKKELTGVIIHIPYFDQEKEANMKNISELKGILGDFLDWNNARLTCFTHALVALFTVRTVNLREVAIAFSSPALASSRYPRLKRFFAQFRIDQVVLARWVFALFFSHADKLYLTIDRTKQ